MKKRIALTIGCFDMLHEGHINLFQKMKEAGDRVFIIIHNNRSIFENKGRFPVQSAEDRAANLLSCGLVNQVFFVHNADPSAELGQILDIFRRKFGSKEADIVYMRGDDWVSFPGREVLEKRGVEIKIIKYTKVVSSTLRREEICRN